MDVWEDALDALDDGFLPVIVPGMFDGHRAVRVVTIEFTELSSELLLDDDSMIRAARIVELTTCAHYILELRRRHRK